MDDWRGRLVRLGLADVLLNLQVLVALFGATRTFRVAEAANIETAVVWFGVCVLAAVWRPGLFVLAALTFTLGATTVPHNGVVLVGWLSAAAGLFSGRQLLTVIRVQTIVVYAFAAANKLFVPFMSGSVLAWSVPWLPMPELFAPIVVFAEGFMALAVWRRWPLAVPAAVILHLGVIVAVAPELVRTVSLVGFNLALVGMVWLSTRLDDGGGVVRRILGPRIGRHRRPRPAR